MSHSVNETRSVKTIIIGLAFMSDLALVDPLNIAHARHGRDNHNRSEFYGIVQSRPENALEGVWVVIGGRTFKADPGTEFDQTEGKLTIGRCAKVHIQSCRVHEFDSEQMRYCRPFSNTILNEFPD